MTMVFNNDGELMANTSISLLNNSSIGREDYKYTSHAIPVQLKEYFLDSSLLCLCLLGLIHHSSGQRFRNLSHLAALGYQEH